jgi:hypothetical protein
VVYCNTGTFVEVYTVSRFQTAVVVVNTSMRPSTPRQFPVNRKKLCIQCNSGDNIYKHVKCNVMYQSRKFCFLYFNALPRSALKFEW